MLIEFTVSNYRSFNEPVTLSMEATKLKDNDDVDRNNIFEVGKYRLLRSAAVYGHNASGKSNLVKAMMFMRDFVRTSTDLTAEKELIDVERFSLDSATQEKPSFFQIIFLLEGQYYRYGFEVDERRVHSEWLYRKIKRESLVFVREDDNYDMPDSFRKEASDIINKTREDALFLSALAQWNNSTASSLLKWFTKMFGVISGLNDDIYREYTLSRFGKDKIFKERIQELIRLADTGITSIAVKSLSDDSSLKSVKTTHPIFKKNEQVAERVFDMYQQESKGTQKFFYLLGPILYTLENGSTLTIDELEARLHPLLTSAIVQMFSSIEANPKNAQLIFTTHNANLLDEKILRRDQIWFTEKNRYGATDLYSLAEMKETSNAPFGKKYLQGRYGAIPYFGDFTNFFEQELKNDENS